MAKRSRTKKAARTGVLPVEFAPGESHPLSILPTPRLGIWMALLLAVVTFLVYWPSLQSDFVYDAHTEILEEDFITSISNLPAVLSLKVLGMNLMLGSRPGQLLYLMLIATVCGKQPFGYHLCSNLLHAANVALLFVLLRRLIAPELSFLAMKDWLKVLLALNTVTLIFALHPIATEPVAAVSYSSDLLVTFFTLTALLSATAFHPENFRTAMIPGASAIFSAFASVTCKESGITTTFLLISYWLLFRRKDAKGPWFWFLGAATVVTAAFLVARFFFAPPNPVHLQYLGGSFAQVFWIQPRLWVFMIGKLILPTQLSADYTLENLAGIRTPFALAFLAVVVLLQIWLSAKSRIGALGCATYWLGLATVSNFTPLNRILADRFYYLPLAGVSMQFLALLLMLLQSRSAFWAVTALLLGSILPLSQLTLTRERVFADNSSLWNDTVQISPFSSTAQNNLGTVLLEKGRTDEAIVQFRKALQIKPNYAEAHSNLGTALAQKGNMALAQKGKENEALDQYNQALQLNPNLERAQNNLADILMKKGRVDEAMAHYQAALQIDPTYEKAHFNLGNAFFGKGQIDDAIAQYRRALEIDPNDAEAHTNLGNSFLEKGQEEDAVTQFQSAVKINPGSVEAHNNLGIAFSSEGQVDEAIVQYEKTLEINPNYAPAHSNYGDALLKKGLVDAAISQYHEALDIDPDSASTHNNLGSALFQKGLTDKAIAQFEEVVRLKPGDRNAQDTLAQARNSVRQTPTGK